MTNTFDSHPPLSRRLALSEVPPEGLDVDIRATPLECAALARHNALPAVHSLQAELRARRRGDGLEIEGALRASIRQTCVTTLDEFDSALVEPIRMRFAPPPDEAPRGRGRDEAVTEITLDEDPPDPLIGGVVDLGAVVSEFFTLALDPYPRKPGANFVEPQPDDGAQAVSPFAALGRLKPRREA
ncbi:DUF177 domain-containing protein [Methylocystis sp. SC2]|uniref:YceD family protein n=1 Tax=Methylocystis sp. (strain SC2) TaxID=187303 RepID=UPI00027AEDE3|nr:DUF177 domain-containing protein [Methylocystis sp. SC2]CCJ08769.1 Conserved hypothetical protein [Methylocystis sp. SC2]